MALSIVFNGVVYSIPETGDESWGESLTSYFTAIPQGALQKTGGTFTLTADVNFGANFGLLAKYFETRSLNPSTAGLFRMAVSDTLAWRNNANNGNLLLAVDGSDQLTFNGSVVLPGGITALTGDGTATGPGSVPFTLATVNSDVGSFAISTITVNDKGLVTAASAATTTGTGSVVLDSSPTLVSPDLGTPTALVGTNITGTAPGLTAGNVTTNANLTGVITSVGNATSIASQTGTGTKFVVDTSPTLISPDLGTPSALISTNITGTAAGLTAGNVTTNANLTGVITSVGNATSIASQTGTGTKFVVDTSPTLVTPVIGVASGTSLNLSGLTASQAVVTDGSKNLASLAFGSTPTASTLMSRDTNGNSRLNSMINNFQTIVSAGTTTTLTVGSPQVTQITGSTTQVINLPDATTLVLGQSFIILNRSSGVVTVNDGALATIQAMASSSQTIITVTNIGSTAGSWDNAYTNVGSGSSPGTVTSVGASGPAGIATWSAAITGAGTLTQTLSSQSARTFLQGPLSGAAATPSFAALTAPTVQKFTANPTGATNYAFTITAGNTASIGAVYTNNGQSFTLIAPLLVGDTVLYCSGTGTPATSGTLTYSSGTHTGGNITFSAFRGAYVLPTSTTPLYIRVRMVGGGGGGSGGGNTGVTPGGVGTDGGNSTFGISLLVANGGKAGTSSSAGGAGGTASLGSGPIGIALSGGSGGGGEFQSGAGKYQTGRDGAASAFGGAGGGAAAGASNAQAGATNTGAGGGGGAGNNTASDSGGTGGGSGGFVDAIITSPSTIYSYAVGTAGSGGAAGTNGTVGQSGGSGLVEVTEYFQ